tara:strand:- start:18510 stop:19532 length:1023 start_codon:yes stop_codon:yes gene_type:complete
MPKVIAEIGVNHNNSEEVLIKLIYGAKEAGADYVKFQRFVSSEEISIKADLANYQKKGNSSYVNQLEMAKALEISDELLSLGIETCKRIDIKPLCSPFELKSIKFIKKILQMNEVKVPSPEITNIPYLEEIAKNFKYIFLSTGASFLWEIGFAIQTIYKISPTAKITLLHCVSEYPAPINSLNLAAMKTLNNAFKLPVGFSDHSEGYIGSIAALTLGAEFIEKHITLDKNMDGPDHRASASLDDLKKICDYSKIVDDIIGNGKKIPLETEIPNRKLIRKSVYLNINKLNAGERLKKNDFSCKRPFNEKFLSPKDIELFIGKKILNDKFLDDGLSVEDFVL